MKFVAIGYGKPKANRAVANDVIEHCVEDTQSRCLEHKDPINTYQ